MLVISIVSLCIVAFAIGSFVSSKITSHLRKAETENWQIGDSVSINHKGDSNLYSDMQIKDGRYAILVGWNKDNVFLSFDTNTYCEKYKVIDFNKSATWRKNFQECVGYMGKNPNFPNGFNHKAKAGEKAENYSDKPIELYTEVECQVFLKKALETEDFEMAEKIRKQLEKYR